MKVLKINPEYVNAPIELGAFYKDGNRVPDPWPFRYNEIPPDGVFGDNEVFAKWQKEHYIPPQIEVEE